MSWHKTCEDKEAGKIIILHRTNSPKLNFALGKLDKVIMNMNYAPEHQSFSDNPSVFDILIVTSASEAYRFTGLKAYPEVHAEGFSIGYYEFNGKSTIFVMAEGESGAMYGTLELAEQMLMNKDVNKVTEKVVNPKFPFRAIKFNLPWSSYRTNECVDNQMETTRSIAFWRKFLDMMAENRYNVLTLWNLHPFPYMIRPKNFPLACTLTDEELKDWKSFWTQLFRMAKERGIEPYIVNWNLMVSEDFRKNYDENASNDSVHWGEAYSTDPIKQYMRECITQTIDEYPDLSGIGTSLGEHMDGMTPKQRQDWIADVYFKALKNASRPVQFIHRAPFTIDPFVTRNSIENSGLPGPIWVEVKFNFSHGYSSPKLFAVHGGSKGIEGYWEPAPKNYKLTLMVRNEDFFTLRWAQPDFVREHIAENSKDYIGGYYIGSEGFIPAMDYSHVKNSPHVNWEYAFEKNRLYYMLWGRLLFDPATPDSVFAFDIGQRYGAEVGTPLLQAYSAACKMPMALATFCASTWDFSLYSEGFISTKLPARKFTSRDFDGYEIGKSFITIVDLCNYKTLDPRYLSIKSYVDHVMGNKSNEGYVTPPELADTLEKDANDALCGLRLIQGDSATLQCEIGDIEAWAHLGLYFADKLRAAVAFEIYTRTGKKAQQRKAIEYLRAPNAAQHWEDLIAVTRYHYVEQPLVSLGTTYFSWELFRRDVQEDIAMVEAYKP